MTAVRCWFTISAVALLAATGFTIAAGPDATWIGIVDLLVTALVVAAWVHVERDHRRTGRQQ